MNSRVLFKQKVYGTFSYEVFISDFCMLSTDVVLWISCYQALKDPMITNTIRTDGLNNSFYYHYHYYPSEQYIKTYQRINCVWEKFNISYQNSFQNVSTNNHTLHACCGHLVSRLAKSLLSYGSFTIWRFWAFN